MLFRFTVHPGSAAVDAMIRKCVKYAALCNEYLFQPVAVRTAGVLIPATRDTLMVLGHQISDMTVEPRKKIGLFGRILLATFRGNVHSILTSANLIYNHSEVYYLFVSKTFIQLKVSYNFVQSCLCLQVSSF